MLNKLNICIKAIWVGLFRKKKEPYFSLSKILGFQPIHRELYRTALLHKSSPEAIHQGRMLNNERLEYLGDAILDAVVGAYLFERFPNRNEGFLTNVRSRIVQRESLNRVCMEWGLDKLIICAPQAASHTVHIYGNTVEALIGAVYLDRGYEACYRFICEKLIKEHIDLKEAMRHNKNDKSYLIEWAQKHKLSIDFKVLEIFSDSNGNMMFQSEVRLAQRSLGIGVGHNKKDSQLKAAKEAVYKIHHDKTIQAFVADCKRNAKLAAEAVEMTESTLPNSEPADIISDQT